MLRVFFMLFSGCQFSYVQQSTNSGEPYFSCYYPTPAPLQELTATQVSMVSHWEGFLPEAKRQV